MNQFPNEFVWGAATAAYQIEGASGVDGRGPCVWDMFCGVPNAVFGGHTGAQACDHYHRSDEDLELIRQIGVKAYRLSVAWPRVLPNGRGRINDKGIAFYDRLIDQLLERGVTPYVTLFHWDFPLALFHQGGWLNRDSAEWFADYADVVSRRLGDRVKNWITLNEPQVYIGLGHHEGLHAPGLKLRFDEVLLAGHHTLLAHGRAVQVLRANSPNSRIGFSSVGLIRVPAEPGKENFDAARRACFETTKETAWSNTWWCDPVLLGSYPEDALRLFGKRFAPPAADLDAIKQPIDFLGLNIYSADAVRAGDDGLPQTVAWPTGHPMTAFNWYIVPDSLYFGPKFFAERYATPLMITENGLSCRDAVALDGKVHDPARIDYTQRHLLALARSIDEGSDVRGYFHWSLMDNFEWAEGYKERFGLVHVDYSTQKRTLKDSALWYRQVIESNGALLFD